MRAGDYTSGYTIIEVMIFLAVSGFMFITAASFVNGKQAEAEFRQSMNETNTQVLTIINDVANGYYPSNNDISCSAPDTPNPPVITTGAVAQGGNRGCVFMGKIILFSPNNDPFKYRIYTVVGRQAVRTPGSAVPTDFTEAQPALVKAASATQTKDIKWSSKVSSAYMGDASNPIYAVGIFNGFGKYTSQMLNSGAQTAMVVPITAGKTEAQIEAALNAPEQLDQYLADNPNPFFTVCLDGGRKKFGNLSIGSQYAQRLSSDFKIGPQAEIGC